MYALKLFLQAVGCRFLFRTFLKKNSSKISGKEKSNITSKWAPKWYKAANSLTCITMDKQLGEI
jgi:hypothetical protein